MNDFHSSGYGFFTRVLIMTVVTMIAAHFLPGINVAGLGAAIGTAVVIAILDTIVRPILLVVTIPISAVTLGGFVFVIDALIIMMASGLVNGFSVRNFWWALLFSLILSLVNYLLERPAQRNEVASRNSQSGMSNPQLDDNHFDDYEDVTDQQ